MRSILGFIGAGALVAACGGIAQTGSGDKPLDGMDAGPGGGAGGDGSGGGLSAGGGHPWPSGGAPSGGFPQELGGTGNLPGCFGCPPAAGGTLPWGGGGAGGATWGTGGASGATSCAQTSDSATIDVSPVPSSDAGFSPTINVVADGRVSSVSSSVFTLDACPLLSQCVPQMLTTVTIIAPGLDLTGALTVGAFAHVHYSRVCPWGCQNAVSVTSLASWNGTANPYPAGSGLYVAADDGITTGEEPYKIEQVPIPGCATQGTGCGAGMVTGAYLQRFSANGTSVDVLMGQTQSLFVGGGMLLLRNLRSQVNGYCDEMGDFAHYAVNQPLRE